MADNNNDDEEQKATSGKTKPNKETRQKYHRQQVSHNNKNEKNAIKRMYHKMKESIINKEYDEEEEKSLPLLNGILKAAIEKTLQDIPTGNSGEFNIWLRQHFDLYLTGTIVISYEEILACNEKIKKKWSTQWMSNIFKDPRMEKYLPLDLSTLMEKSKGLGTSNNGVPDPTSYSAHVLTSELPEGNHEPGYQPPEAYPPLASLPLPELYNNTGLDILSGIATSDSFQQEGKEDNMRWEETLQAGNTSEFAISEIHAPIAGQHPVGLNTTTGLDILSGIAASNITHPDKQDNITMESTTIPLMRLQQSPGNPEDARPSLKRNRTPPVPIHEEFNPLKHIYAVEPQRICNEKFSARQIQLVEVDFPNAINSYRGRCFLNQIRRKQDHSIRTYRKRKTQGIMFIQSNTLEIFLEESKETNTSCIDDFFRRFLPEYKKDGVNLLCEYMKHQAGKIEDVQDKHLHFASSALLVSFAGSRGQVPHVDIIAGNFQFIMSLSRNARPTLVYNTDPHVNSVSTLIKIMESLPCDLGYNRTMPQTLREALEQTQTMVEDYGNCLHSSEEFQRTETPACTSFNPGQTVGMRDRVTHAGPPFTVEEGDMLLLHHPSIPFLDTPKEEEKELDPSDQLPVRVGGFIIGTVPKAKAYHYETQYFSVPFLIELLTDIQLSTLSLQDQKYMLHTLCFYVFDVPIDGSVFFDEIKVRKCVALRKLIKFTETIESLKRNTGVNLNRKIGCQDMPKEQLLKLCQQFLTNGK